MSRVGAGRRAGPDRAVCTSGHTACMVGYAPRGDYMPWAKFDDKFCSHPKVIAAGPLAVTLHMRAIIYSSLHLTDGVIRPRTLRYLVDWEDDADDFAGQLPKNRELAKRLVNAGLWEEAPDGVGWQIHDYLDWNPSREGATSLSLKRAEAGRKGGRASAATRRPDRTEDPPEANGQANASANGQANAEANAEANCLQAKPFASVCLAFASDDETPDPASGPDGRSETAPETGSKISDASSQSAEIAAESAETSGSKTEANAKQLLEVCLKQNEPRTRPVPTTYVQTSTDVCTSVRSNADDAPRQAVVVLPLVSGEYAVTQDEADELAAAYPGVDVVAELNAMRQWCLSNARRRKSAKGVRRFITGWLSRERPGRSAPRGNGRASGFADVTRAAMEWARGEDEADRVRSADDKA